MMTNSIRIAIAEPSPIIRLGLEAQLKKLPRYKVSVHTLIEDSKKEVAESLSMTSADIYILNPLLCGLKPHTLLPQGTEAKVVALSYGTTDHNLLKDYDGIISITDTMQELSELLNRFVEPERVPASESQDLTAREREILLCVVKGMTNKRIAEHLFLSQHTVVTHRRNIGQKLQIKSPSGLAVYAMMHNLIESADIGSQSKHKK